jgi:hypothetical protein
VISLRTSRWGNRKAGASGFGRRRFCTKHKANKAQDSQISAQNRGTVEVCSL